MAAAKSAKQNKVEFDYELSKAEYYKLVYKTKHALFTRKHYDSVVKYHERVKDYKHENPDKESDSVVDSFDTLSAEQMQARIQNSTLHSDTSGLQEKHVLVVKNKTLEGQPLVRYLPVEDTFDVLIRFHLATDHGGSTEMVNIASPKSYITNAIYLEFLLMSCNTCALGEYSESQSSPNAYVVVGRSDEWSFNRIVQCDAIGVDRRRYDGNFKCLLIYHDFDTGYTLLRPLLSRCAFEVATELLKIFSGFGPPKVIEVANVKIKFFNEVMSHLNQLLIQRQKTTVTAHWNVKCAKIYSAFFEWVKKTGNYNWGLGCQIFQWEINNEIRKTDVTTPFKNVFGDSNLKLNRHMENVDHVDSDSNDELSVLCSGETEMKKDIQATDATKYSTTEKEIREVLDKKTMEIELLPVLKQEPDEINKTVEYFFQQMPGINIKKELMVEVDETDIQIESLDQDGSDTSNNLTLEKGMTEKIDKNTMEIELLPVLKQEPEENDTYS